MIRPATQIGDPVIRAKARPVPSPLSPRTRKIVRDLVDSMRRYGLVGMAAPQIGVGVRIFVTEIRATNVRHPKEADPVRVFINPRIVRHSARRRTGGEGCGSVAHAQLFGMVPRWANVTVTAFDQKGKRFTLTASGLLAAVVQHETDHLNGTIFLDRLPNMKSLVDREVYIKKSSKKA